MGRGSGGRNVTKSLRKLTQVKYLNENAVADLGEGPRASPLFLDQTEARSDTLEEGPFVE